MWAEIPTDAVTTWGQRVADLGGWTAVITLCLAFGIALHRGWLRLGREVQRPEKEAADLLVDRNRWIDTNLKHMEIVHKLGESIDKLKDSVEDLSRMVEKLADEIRKGPGKG